MSQLIGWTVTAVVVALLAVFALYVAGMARLRLGSRPHTPYYDRYGRQLGMHENPDYHVNPGQDHAKDPDLL